eukprot:TRINITY_DN34020_c0_g1_i1.p1 TRINITY_DN34020_c0_g1~~TRINITY_DN34020_c0_g1_i1.p1  ORF type:complete len:290 (+),score=53.19 TRINITY_DN34020_c0_g1_i1:34-870(+)
MGILNSETLSRIPGYLFAEDIAKWQIVDVATHLDLDDDCMWQRIVQREAPEFVAVDELYERETRKTLMRCYAAFLHTNFALFSDLSIGSDEEASIIDSRLRMAASTCSAYRGRDDLGREAHVLLGYFDLTPSSVATRFAFGFEDGEEGSPIVGLPAGFLELAMSLGPDGNSLMTRAEYLVADVSSHSMRPYREARNVQLVLNVASATRDMFLSFHGIPVVFDGLWRSSSRGLWKNNGSSRVNGGHVHALCALTLINSSPPHSSVSLLNAMNLTTSQSS